MYIFTSISSSVYVIQSADYFWDEKLATCPYVIRYRYTILLIFVAVYLMSLEKLIKLYCKKIFIYLTNVFSYYNKK